MDFNHLPNSFAPLSPLLITTDRVWFYGPMDVLYHILGLPTYGTLCLFQLPTRQLTVRCHMHGAIILLYSVGTSRSLPFWLHSRALLPIIGSRSYPTLD
ncbi:uncharacterized protein BDV14DRAFT_161867 [Aspergillus stella-maris]|uniref:uncharacterized protein n=1 Tax=Aspergillus stella-maris TaxID=1810926 RepID=UPI003CCE3FF1